MVKINIRQQKYKRNRLKGMNQYNAARAAGYSEEYSRQACRIEKLVKVSISDAFEQAGITDKYLANLAAEALEATKVSGEPDWYARHKYFESVSKMTDRLKDKHEITGKDGKSLMPPVIIYEINRTTDDTNIHPLESSRGVIEAGS